jgi:hypothetical protein
MEKISLKKEVLHNFLSSLEFLVAQVVWISLCSMGIGR